MKALEEIDLENASLEDLVVEHRYRDALVQHARGEMAQIKTAIDRHEVRMQTEAAGRAPQNLTRSINFEIGGTQ